MAVGLSATNFADVALNYFCRATAGTVPPANYVALALGDPGAAGTANPTSVTTRVVVTFAAPAGTDPRTVSLTGTAPSWASWAGTSPTTISHIAIWSAVTAGSFLYSAVLTASKTVTTGDTFTLSSLQVGLGGIAA